MKRLQRVLLAILLFVVGFGHASADAIWWANDAIISRFESSTGQQRSRETPARVRAIAPVPDGGAWLVVGDTLMFLDHDLATTIVVSMERDTLDAPTFAAADADGGAWVAAGAWLHHFDRAGVPVLAWRRETSITALAVGGPRAIWLADTSGIHQVTAEGVVVQSIQPIAGSTPSAMLLDPAGGYLWVLNTEFAIQLDVLARFAEQTRFKLPPETSAAAVDVATGTLWLLSHHNLATFNRDATPVASWQVPRGAVNAPSALAIDILADRLWIGDVLGTTALNRETMQWIRLTSGEPTSVIAGAYRSLMPTLTLSSGSALRPTDIRFQFGAHCNGVPCTGKSRYLQKFELRASIGGSDIGDQFAIDRDAGTAHLSNIESLNAGSSTLRASVSDTYGNHSAELELDLPTLLGTTRNATQRKVNALPTVSITAPANNAIFVAPVTVAIAASAADSDGTITKVEFYRDAVLLGTDTTSPYSFSWANAPIGLYKLTAKAYDNAGGITTSAIVNIQVKANVAPTVSLTAPVNNSAYTAPASINMTATAADSDGTIASVDFYQGTTKLGTDTTAPYAFSWSNVASGTYSLTAKATDNKGAVTTSSTVTVKVNQPPAVTISAPPDNTILLTPATATISATASDSGGSVSKVEFYRDGVLLGTDTTSPYSYVWSNIPVGTYVITAKATDNLGATTVSAARTLRVNANLAPTVTLSSPANGASFIAGVPVVISATATDPDGAISKVDFFRDNPTYGNSLIGSDSTSPYSITVPLSLGDNALTAVATDNKGATTTSAPIAITVIPNQLPSVTLTSPVNGQAFPALTPPDIALAATANDADGTIANVKFYYRAAATADDPSPVRNLLATIATPPFQFVWRAVPNTGVCINGVCSPSDYEVTAEATDNAGGVTGSDSAYITVPNSTPWTLEITAPFDNFPVIFRAPATLVLNATTQVQPLVADPVVKVEFFGDGNLIGTIVGAPNGGAGEYVSIWRNVSAGTHVVSAKLYDAAGFVVNAYPVTIKVREFTEPPTVAVTAPANGQSYLSNQSVPIVANASDVDGTIAQIAVSVDDVQGSPDVISPTSATWTGVRIGVHVVSATATDNGFAQANAKPVHIRVLPDKRLQAVVLTSPAPGTVTNPVELVADVGAPDGGMDKVHFYDGTTLLGSVVAPPYRLVVSLGNGVHTIKARAVLFSNAGMESTPVTITVSGANVAPSVTLTAPYAGQTFVVGSPVSLAANASDPDGSITKVEFFAGSTLVATDTTAPYSGIWMPGGAGAFALTAKATDNQGRTTTTAPINVTISSNVAPQVSLTAPANAQTYFAGVPFAVTANATDADGTITKVEFYAGATLIGTVTSSPYTINWSALAAGTYVLTAKATDNSNAVTASTGVSISITANALPTVSLSMPRNGQAFASGATVNLIAVASDGDGSVARIDFYAGTTLLGSATTAPYSFAWTNVASGNYSLTANSIDNRGAVTTSAVVAIAVQPLALSVTSPADNASIDSDFVLITGTFAAPANSGVTVNGMVAKSDGQGSFFVNNFPLAAGANTISITLTTAQGQATTVTRNVTRTGIAPFQISADPDLGFGPLTATIRVTNRGTSPLATASFANLGPGVVDTSVFSTETIARIAYSTPGIYQPSFTITDAAGNVYTQKVAIMVQDKAALDRMLKVVWGDFVVALGSGSKDLAMNTMSVPARAKYGTVFDDLAPYMAQIVSDWSTPVLGRLSDEIGEYAIRRTVNGFNQLFFVYFLRDGYGSWRLGSM